VKDVGEPGDREGHARIDGGWLETDAKVMVAEMGARFGNIWDERRDLPHASSISWTRTYGGGLVASSSGARAATYGRSSLSSGRASFSGSTDCTDCVAPSVIRGQRNHAKKTIGEPCARKSLARFERGRGSRAAVRIPRP